MLRTIILLSILLTTLKSFGQIDTKIPYDVTKDSVVIIPKQVVIWMIQEINLFDSYKEENIVLHEVINLKSTIINTQDSIINTQKTKIRLKENQIDSYQDIMNEQELQQRVCLKLYNKEVKHKKFWKTMAIIGPIVTGAILIYKL